MCALIEFQNTKRCKRGKVIAASNAGQFRVKGTLDGVAFDRTFPTVAAWRSWKRLQRAEIEVRSMGSENA